MIISHSHNFVFVHIPKCAGTSVRHVLRPYGAYYDAFGGAKGDHIPLVVLAAEHPKIFAHLKEMSSFSIIRNPTDRFFSAVIQKLIDFDNKTYLQLSDDDIAQCAMSALRAVKEMSVHQLYHSDYIHFIPQVDFIYLNDVKVVDRVFRLDDMAALFDYLCCELMIPISAKVPHNRGAYIPRNAVLGRSLNLLNHLSSGLVQPQFRSQIRAWFHKVGILREYRPRLRLSHLVKELAPEIERSYAADWELWGSRPATQSSPDQASLQC